MLKVPSSVEPVKRLDLSKADFGFGLRSCFTSSESQRREVEQALELEWAGETGDALTALSVRTGFDALLAALRLPRQTEVLMSAVTIPDMVKIVQSYGLVPIPIDVDYDTLAPRQDLMAKALSTQTRVLVVSHIFGSIAELDDIITWAHKHGVYVVEDCAEAYCGPDFRGHENVDASFFSFGTIKTETALGGAMMRIADSNIREDVRAILAHYAVQPLHVFRNRLIKYSAFTAILNNSVAYATFVRGVHALGKDHLDILLANSRGFVGQDLFQAIRLRPPVPLLKLLLHRLQNFDASRLEQRRKICARTARDLANIPGVRVPGLHAKRHYFWLFPINVADPTKAAKAMLSRGFDATSGTTSLMCIDDVVSERPANYREVFDATTSVAAPLMHNVLYLPIDSDTSSSIASNMVRAVKSSCSSAEARL